MSTSATEVSLGKLGKPGKSTQVNLEKSVIQVVEHASSQSGKSGKSTQVNLDFLFGNSDQVW